MLSGAMLSIVGSILGVIVTGVIGIIAYAWQENVKRKTALAESKRNLYEILIRNLIELLAAENSVERSKLISEIEKGWLFASDDVLHAFYKYLNIYDRYWTQFQGEVLAKVREDPTIRQEFANGVAGIFLAMRRDIRSTEIKDDWAKRNLKIYEWGIIHTPNQTNGEYRLSRHKRLMSKLLRRFVCAEDVGQPGAS